ncbi:MAG TPA: hypothetical protein VIY96_11605 [Thermoanaerobaculia bacterium]
MDRRADLLRAAAVVAALGSGSPLLGQAFTLPQGVGAVTFAWQYVNNTGHRLSDGFLRRAGQSVTESALLEAEYGVTDRLSASFGVPYVWAKYTGALPPPSGLPVDACKCWHSGLQDFAFTARYRLGTDTIALTPHVRYVLPSHDYPYKGEAVLGRDLHELQVGASAGARLPGVLSKGSVQASYTYAFVEKPVHVDINRSNLFFDIGYAPTRRLYARVGANYQDTPGGLRIGSVTGRPFFLPGDYRGHPDLFAQRDRIGRVKYWQVGGGLSYDVGPADVFAAVSSYIWGRDAHDGEVYTVGATWYFDFRK